MRRKYKILITISEFMYSSQVRNLCDLVSGLDRSIFDIEIGALAVGDEATREVVRLDIPYYQLRLQPSRNVTLRNTKDFLKGLHIIINKDYDIVHSLLYQSLFTEPFIIKLFTRAKYIYTKSNLEWDNHKINWNLKSRLADRIISISHATDELLIERGFGNKTQKVFLGIDTEMFKRSVEKRKYLRERYNIRERSLVFGCAAQFVEWKEHLTLLSAFESLSQHYNDIYLLMCGPHHNDAYYQDVLRTIENSPAAEKIFLLGTLNDMPVFYSAIDCFVLASRYEPFGYVYVEAMSCERPVIACRAGGPLEIIIDNKTGYFTKMSSPEDLSKKMEIYIKNRALMVQHGKLARTRTVELFSKDTMVKNCQKLYLDLLK